MNIGDWVRRKDRGLGRKSRKWHLVDSVVDDDAFTRCGRRMRNARHLKPLEVSDVMPLTRIIGQPQLCQVCQ